MLQIFRGGRRSQGAARSADDEPAKQGEVGAAPQGPESNASANVAESDRAPERSDTGFVARGRLRRRGRFLRAARELAYRDLGGLVFDLDRFGQRNDAVLRAKLDTLRRIDSELRAVEGALDRPASLTILREAGVAACPRCAAIHSSADRYCPACGLPSSQADRPIGAAHAMPQHTQSPHQAFSPPPGTGGAIPSQPVSPTTPTPPPAQLAGASATQSVQPPGMRGPSADEPAARREHDRDGGSADESEASADEAEARPPASPPDRTRSASSQQPDEPTEVVSPGEREAEEPSAEPEEEQRTRAFDPVASIRSLRHRERR